MSCKDTSIAEISLPGLISRKVQSMHDDVNEMKTDLKAEKKKTQNTKWTDDRHFQSPQTPNFQR
jgi:hypothetical protein